MTERERDNVKYGLIVYTDSPNLGDDLQSYAAKQYLPHVDYYIEREQMDSFIPDEPEMVAVILNGWYLYDHLAWPPSDFIHPLITSIHFDTSESMHGRSIEENYAFDYAGADYLVRHSPVGCRDYPTFELMTRHCIDSFYSGCLSLTLEKFPDIAKTNEILFVDACWDERNEIARDAVQKATEMPVRILTHFTPRPMLANMPYVQRMDYAEERLKLYQQAQAVVTTRLHCALPCLALGTPVLLIKEDASANRIGTYYNLFEHSSIDDVIAGRATDFFKSPPPLPTGWEQQRDNLRTACETFIKNASTASVMPSISEHTRRDAMRMAALKRIVRENADALLDVRTQNTSLQQKNTELLLDIDARNTSFQQERQMLEAQINESNHQLFAIQNSTSWKITKPLRKIADIFRPANR